MQNKNVEALLESVKQSFGIERPRISGDKGSVRMNMPGFGDKYFHEISYFRFNHGCEVAIRRSGAGIVVIFTPKKSQIA